MESISIEPVEFARIQATIDAEPVVVPELLALAQRARD